MPGPNLFQIRRTSVADREANTITLPNVGEIGVNLTDGRMWVANSTSTFEIGANTKNCRVSNSFFVGDGSINTAANSTQITTDIAQLATAVYIGANVDLTTVGLIVGNTTTNLIANSTTLKLANSTVNTALRVPTVGQYAATNYFLHANGQWVQVTSGTGSGVTRVYESFTATGGQTTFTVAGGYTVGQIEVFVNGVHLANTEYTEDGATVVLDTGALVGSVVEVAGYKDINVSEIVPEPAGANTEVQFNDSLTTNASAGFTFDKGTNNVFIANTLIVDGGINANGTVGVDGNVLKSNGTISYWGTAASGTVGGSNTYVLFNDSTLANGVAGFTFNKDTNNAIIANTLTAAQHLSTNFAANSTGVFHTATINAAAFTTTGFRANVTHVVSTSNSSGQSFGNTISRWVITANSVTTSGGVSPDSNSLGTALGSTTQRWVLLANTIESTGLANLSALNVVNQTNTATLFATTSATVGANVIANTTAITVGNSTVNTLIGNSVVDIGNTTINAVANSSAFKLANSTVTWTLVKPTAAQVSSADYYAASDGVWKQVVAGATPGGSNTHIQYNDSTALGGSAGFTFDETTNNVTLANTLFLGTGTTNVIANSTMIRLANSTVTYSFIKPTAAQVSSADYYPASDGAWKQVTGGASANLINVTINGTSVTLIDAFAKGVVYSNEYLLTVDDQNQNALHASKVIVTHDEVIDDAYCSEYAVVYSNTVAGPLGSYSANANATHCRLYFTPTVANTFVKGYGLGQINITANMPAAAGSDTYVQYNTSAAMDGSAGFTFDETTNNVLIANSLTVGTATINSTNYSQTANNTIYVGGNVFSNSTGIYPLSNTSGDEFGNTIARWVITANSSTLSGGLNSATVNATTSVAVGVNNIINTTTIQVGNSTINVLIGNATVLIGNTTDNSTINSTGVGYSGNGTFLSNGSTSAMAFGFGKGGVYGSYFQSFANNWATAAQRGGSEFVFDSRNSGTGGFAIHQYDGAFTQRFKVEVGGNVVVNGAQLSVGGSLLSANVQVNPQTGTTYTLAAADSGKIVTMNNAGAMTVTVPAGLPIGFRTQVLRLGAGTCTLSNTGQTGCSIFSRTAAFAVTTQYGSASVFQTATANTYIIDGNI